MDREKQIAGLLKVLKDSRAVTYEPNAYPIELCRHGQKKFYVSERDGHLTIDYGVFAKDLYDAGYRKKTEWISADNPPKEFGKYLVACKGIDIPQIRLWEGTWDSLAEVTHWQPLPKLP